MKEIIFYCIIGLLFVLNVAEIIRTRKNSNFVYKVVFLKRPLDWLISFSMIVLLIVIIFFIEPIIPQFLKFSWFSLLGKDSNNANMEIFNQVSNIGKSPESNYALKILSHGLLTLIFIFFMLMIPKAAFWEENQFRYGYTTLRSSAWSNIKFGMAHCIVGVPIYIGMVLILIGFVFSIRYINVFKKNEDYIEAGLASTSLHGKYNIVAILIFYIILMFF